MISTGVERHSGSHGIRTQNAVSANVFGDNQFIGLESDSTRTSKAVKNGIIPDLKKTLFGLTSIQVFTLALFLQNISARPQTIHVLPLSMRACLVMIWKSWCPHSSCSAIAHWQTSKPAVHAIGVTGALPESFYSPYCSIAAYTPSQVQDLSLSDFIESR